MDKQQKQCVGEGKDNYASAVNKVKSALKAIKKGAEAGKAVGEIATGAGVGGVTGAVVGAVWLMRHTIYKVIICIALVVLFLVMTIAAVPHILLENIGTTYDKSSDISAIEASFDDLFETVSRTTNKSYAEALEKAEQIIADNEYDYELSMLHLKDNLEAMQKSDICYIIAVYSVATDRYNSNRADLSNRLKNISYSVMLTYEERQATVSDNEDMKSVKYSEFKVHGIEREQINESFGVDVNSEYKENGVTYGDMINCYNALMTSILNEKESKWKKTIIM